jgi:hypothetical protein
LPRYRQIRGIRTGDPASDFKQKTGNSGWSRFAEFKDMVLIAADFAAKVNPQLLCDFLIADCGVHDHSPFNQTSSRSRNRFS